MLTWNPVSGGTVTYTVWRSLQSASVGPAVTYTQIGSPTSSTSFTDNTVSDGTTYFYVVSALVDGCSGPISTEVRAIVPAAPPTGLTATPGSGQVALSWTASSGAISYNVKRSTTPGGPYSTVATTGSPSATDITGGGTFYYVVTAVNHPLAGESRNSSEASAVVLYLVLNEIKANPPGSVNSSPPQPDSIWEYIELKGSPGYNLVNHRVVVLNGANASPIGRGKATLVVPLSGTVPASGIVMIKQDGHASAPGTLEILVQPQHRISVADGNTDDELIVNNASTVLLTYGGTAPAVGTDYDNGNDGELDDPAWYGLGQTVLDSLGWKSADAGDLIYNGASSIQQAVSVPDAATRFPGNVVANSPSAWYGGCLDPGCEDYSSTTYDPDPNKRTANFPVGGWLTPGAPNDTTTINLICPQSGVVADAFNPDINLTVSPTTVIIMGATSGDQSVVPDANITIINNGGGSFTARINPIKVGYNVTIRLTPSSGAPRPFLYAASAYDFPMLFYAWTYFRTNGFHAGASDSSTAIPISPDLMFVGDDEKNGIKLYYRAHSGLFLSEFDFSTQLGVTKELDIEASTAVGTHLYWMGSHANDSSGGFHRALNREKIFQTDVTGSGTASTLNYIGSYSSFKDQVTAWDATQVPTMQLATYAADGVDPNTPTGFSIEGLAIASDQTKAYVGFRAPLVPPGNWTKALLISVNNFTSVATGSAPGFGSEIQLDLGSRGIRSIELYSGLNYIIVAGRPSDSLSDFAIFNWVEGAATADEWCADLAGRQVEGVIEVLTPGVLASGSQIRILEDSGDYDWYNNGIKAKDLSFKNYRKARSTIITLGQKASVTYNFVLMYAQGGLGAIATPGGNGNYGELTAIDRWTGIFAVGQTYDRNNLSVLIGFALWHPETQQYASVWGPFTYASPGPTTALTAANDPMHAGYTTPPGGSDPHAALWVDPDAFVDAHPVGYVSSEILGMNRVSAAPERLVGFGAVTGQDATAAYWEFDWGSFIATAHLLNGLPSSSYTKAFAVNLQNQIVGYSGTAAGIRNACIWEPDPVTGSYGNPVALPDLSTLSAGQETRANAINDNGTIVGYSYLSGVKHACVWQRKGSAYAVYDLGVLSASQISEARDINNRGQIVGIATDSGGVQRACTWINGRIVDLNTKTAPTGTLTTANGIGDNGIIVGGTLSSGQMKGYTLAPQ